MLFSSYICSHETNSNGPWMLSNVHIYASNAICAYIQSFFEQNELQESVVAQRDLWCIRSLNYLPEELLPTSYLKHLRTHSVYTSVHREVKKATEMEQRTCYEVCFYFDKDKSLVKQKVCGSLRRCVWSSERIMKFDWLLLPQCLLVRKLCLCILSQSVTSLCDL